MYGHCQANASFRFVPGGTQAQANHQNIPIPHQFGTSINPNANTSCGQQGFALTSSCGDVGCCSDGGGICVNAQGGGSSYIGLGSASAFGGAGSAYSQLGDRYSYVAAGPMGGSSATSTSGGSTWDNRGNVKTWNGPGCGGSVNY